MRKFVYVAAIIAVATLGLTMSFSAQQAKATEAFSISNITVTVWADYANIHWEANEQSSHMVSVATTEAGVDSNPFYQEPMMSSLLTYGKTVPNLTSSTTYYYKIVSTPWDDSDNVHTNRGQFTTTPDATISVSFAQAVPSLNSAVVNWTTSIASYCQLWYGTDTQQVMQHLSPVVSEPTTEEIISHSLSLTNLNANTFYNYQIVCFNPDQGQPSPFVEGFTTGTNNSIDLEPTSVNWTSDGLKVFINNNDAGTFSGSFVVSLFDLTGQSYVDYYTFTGTLVGGHGYNAMVNSLYGSEGHYPNLRITVDYSNHVTETNENNNSIEHHYAAPMVDLQPMALSWTDDGLRLTVKNNGSSNFSGSFSVSLFDLSSSTYVDYYSFTGAINAGQQNSFIISSSNSYPNLRVMVDYGNTVPETNETNNSIDFDHSDGNQITISNVVVTNLNPTRVMVTWTASHESDGQLRYSANEQEVDQIDLQHALIDWFSPGEVNHSITISGLHPHRTYYFRLDSTNGNYGEAVPYHGSFTTLPNLPNDDDEEDDDGDENDGLSDRERQLMEKINRLQLRISELERALAQREKSLVSKVDQKLTEKLKGKILLQVEDRGQAWYVDKEVGKKFYLKDGESAYNALQAFGLGIKNNDLKKIPVALETEIMGEDTDQDGLDDKTEEALGTDPAKADLDGDGYNDKQEVVAGYDPLTLGKLPIDASFAKRLEGKILLQVEKRGQAWYIHDGKRYYVKDGETAYQLMRKKSLGITNDNLRKIDVGEFE